MSVWADSPLLLSNNPNLPVGANDMAFDRGQHYLYIDNTGNRQMFRIPVEPDGSAGPLQLCADGATIDSQLGLAGPVALYGADGIQFDVRGNLYVMANQADEVQVLSPAGELIARYIGTGVNALDFNASPVFEGRQLYITNMSGNDGGINSKVSVMTAPYPGLLPTSQVRTYGGYGGPCQLVFGPWMARRPPVRRSYRGQWQTAAFLVSRGLPGAWHPVSISGFCLVRARDGHGTPQTGDRLLPCRFQAETQLLRCWPGPVSLSSWCRSMSPVFASFWHAAATDRPLRKRRLLYFTAVPLPAENHRRLLGAGNDGLSGGDSMAGEEVGGHRTQPVRIIHMSVASADPRPSVDALMIVAKLAGPDQEELQWWVEQLRDRVKVRSWVGSAGRLTSVQVEAPEDQFEAVARRLIAAVDEANAAYPERYPVWRREHDARMAEERLGRLKGS